MATKTKTKKKAWRPFTDATYESYSTEVINRARAVLNTVGDAKSQMPKRPFKFKPVKGKPQIAHILDRAGKPMVRSSGHTIELSLTALKSKKKKATRKKARSKVRTKRKSARVPGAAVRRAVARKADAVEGVPVDSAIELLRRASRQDAVLGKLKALLDSVVG